MRSAELGARLHAFGAAHEGQLKPIRPRRADVFGAKFGVRRESVADDLGGAVGAPWRDALVVGVEYGGAGGGKGSDELADFRGDGVARPIGTPVVVADDGDDADAGLQQGECPDPSRPDDLRSSSTTQKSCVRRTRRIVFATSGSCVERSRVAYSPQSVWRGCPSSNSLAVVLPALPAIPMKIGFLSSGRQRAAMLTMARSTRSSPSLLRRRQARASSHARRRSSSFLTPFALREHCACTMHLVRVAGAP